MLFIKLLVILSPLKPLLTCLLTLHVPVQALVAIDVEDLEVDATPEDLMLSYVSGEKGKVRIWAVCDVLGELMCRLQGSKAALICAAAQASHAWLRVCTPALWSTSLAGQRV